MNAEIKSGFRLRQVPFTISQTLFYLEKRFKEMTTEKKNSERI
jgi:hypothetical protein